MQTGATKNITSGVVKADTQATGGHEGLEAKLSAAGDFCKFLESLAIKCHLDHILHVKNHQKFNRLKL